MKKISKHKTLIQKLKSQNRKQKNLLKLCNPETVKTYLENIKIFKEEIERLTEKNKSLQNEVYFYKTKVEAFGKKNIFQKFWEVVKNGK